MLPRGKVKIIENQKYSITNMVWSLFCAEKEIKGPVMVSYGGIVYSNRILEALLAAEGDILITIDKNWKEYWTARFNDPLSDVETLKFGSNGNIEEIGQVPESLEEIQGQYMGLMRFSEKGGRMMKDAYHAALARGDIRGKKVEQAHMTDLLQQMIDIGLEVKAVSISNHWVEIDTAQDLLDNVTIERVSAIDREMENV